MNLLLGKQEKISRVSNHQKYRDCPLWENLNGKNRHKKGKATQAHKGSAEKRFDGLGVEDYSEAQGSDV